MRSGLCRPYARPIRYIGQEKIKRDIANLKKAMAASGAEEGFLPSSAPLTSMKNEYYKTQEEYVIAFGDAMREEYKAILDAGLLLQIDFPRLVSSWDGRPNISLSEYRKWAEREAEHLTMPCVTFLRTAFAFTPATE